MEDALLALQVGTLQQQLQAGHRPALNLESDGVKLSCGTFTLSEIVTAYSDFVVAYILLPVVRSQVHYSSSMLNNNFEAVILSSLSSFIGIITSLYTEENIAITNYIAA